jgi:hypothetical protein
MGASSSKACSIDFLIENAEDSNEIRASSSEACSIEFRIEINDDYNGIGASK